MNRFRQAFARVFEGGRPLVLAHRGDSFGAPENTLDAAGLGYRAGADGWEFDVRLTQDLVPVVIHDASLLRTTDVATVYPNDPRADLGYLVSEFRLDEIRRLDAGSWFVDPEGGPRSARGFGTLSHLDSEVARRSALGTVRVPTLDEALAFTVDHDWMVNVEIKSDYNGDETLIVAVLAAIHRFGMAGSVLVSSFDHNEVARVSIANREVATGVLCGAPLFDPISYIKVHVRADAYHIAASSLGIGGARYLRQGDVHGLISDHLADCRRSHLPVLVYTVNEVKMAGHLADTGVAGLFTDDPAGIVAGFTPSGGHTSRRSDEAERRSAALPVSPIARPSRSGRSPGTR